MLAAPTKSVPARLASTGETKLDHEPVKKPAGASMFMLGGALTVRGQHVKLSHLVLRFGTDCGSHDIPIVSMPERRQTFAHEDTPTTNSM